MSEIRSAVVRREPVWGLVRAVSKDLRSLIPPEALQNQRRAVPLRSIRIIFLLAAAIGAASGFFPKTAAAIDVEFIEFFKGVDRQSGTIPPNFAYFAELCVEGTDITSASVRLPDGSTDCPMDDIFGTEYCCDQNFDTQLELDNAFPSGPGQNYTVNITGPGGPDSEVVEFDVAAPTAYTDITSPTAPVIIDTNQDLVITWVLADAGGCNLAMPADCADGIAVFVSTTTGVDEDVYENDELAITATMATVPNAVLQPNTEYRVEVETVRGTEDVLSSTDGLSDAYRLSRFAEDINSVVVPEPAQRGLHATALAVLLGVAQSRRRS